MAAPDKASTPYQGRLPGCKLGGDRSARVVTEQVAADDAKLIEKLGDAVREMRGSSSTPDGVTHAHARCVRREQAEVRGQLTCIIGSYIADVLGVWCRSTRTGLPGVPAYR